MLTPTSSRRAASVITTHQGHAKGEGRHREVTTTFPLEDGGKVSTTRIPGYAPSRKDDVARAVCAGCNNGWMAQLESEAKPIIIRQWDRGCRR